MFRLARYCGFVFVLIAALTIRVEASEVLVGPITVPTDYAGIDLSVPVRAFLNVETAADGISVNTRLLGDLGNLQNRIAQVIDTFPLPKDNCASYGTNPVVSIWGKELQAAGTQAVLSLHGYVDLWGCASNPIPNSKVEWRNDGPFGLSIPHVVTWPGDPIKTTLGRQPFDVTLPVALQVVDEHTVALRPGTPNITLGGQYVGITGGILRIAGIDINGRAGDALHHAIDPEKLQQALPQEILQLNPKITKAEFQNVGGRLGVELDLSSKIPPAKLTSFLQMLIEAKPK
jgi:hypothetical protein